LDSDSKEKNQKKTKQEKKKNKTKQNKKNSRLLNIQTQEDTSWL